MLRTACAVYSHNHGTSIPVNHAAPLTGARALNNGVSPCSRSAAHVSRSRALSLRRRSVVVSTTTYLATPELANLWFYFSFSRLCHCRSRVVQCRQISDHTPQQLAERLPSSFQSEIMYDKKSNDNKYKKQLNWK